MSFRIGITIGDVVERDGDLLGDGVNIAARLEGLAEVGGICVSRAVHEQVANKLSVQFADIGAQEVKNIPTPVHAYMVAMRREDGSYATPQVKKVAKATPAPNWMWPLVVGVVSVVAIGVGGFLYFTKLETTPAAIHRGGACAEPVAVVTPSPTPTMAAKAPMPMPTPTQMAAATPMPSPPAASGGKIPVECGAVHRRAPARLSQQRISPAGDYKAFALNVGGFTGAALNQPNEEAARNAALDQCQKRADAAQSPRRCELYAVGNKVVYTHGRPPMPPQPWVRHDTMIERPFVSKDFPMLRDQAEVARRERVRPGQQNRVRSRSDRVDNDLHGNGGIVGRRDDTAFAGVLRRDRRHCLHDRGGRRCFVVPIPTLLRINGFFHAASNSSIVADARDDVVRKLGDGMGWNAVAVGTAGRPGLGLKAADEHTAVNAALADCVRHDSDCHVIAIGPFTVGPTN